MENLRLLNNRYELQEAIGKGGMAVIYKARDVMLERTVAVKLLREDYSLDPVFQQRFRLEARSAANLSHPNIVTVHDFGLDHGQLYLVIEYVPGTDLKVLIRRKGKFSVEDALPLMIQACAGIGYAHRAGLVHCDVKPQNMLVMPDTRLKVTDFGIARALATIRPDEHSDVVWGSPQYFSPEQAAGEAPSPASDVYSLGVVLYEMLAGKLPYEADSYTELARLHIEAIPPDIRSDMPDLPNQLEQILLKVLSREASQRYRTADQLGRVLTGLTDVEKSPVLALTPETAPAANSRVRVLPRVSSRVQAAPKVERSTPQAAEEPASSLDWLTLGLGFLTVTLGLGLIPFWVWVYFVYNPPIR